MRRAAWVRCFAAIALWIGGALPASALRLDLMPADSTIALSGSVPLSLVVSGLNADSQNVSAYDILLAFNPAIINVTGVVFGTGLGGPSDSIQGTDPSVPGALQVFEVSFLLDAALAGLQGDSVTLAVLNFSGVGLGTSSVEFTSVTMVGKTDANGLPTTLEPALGGARVTVVERPTPEPGSLLLLAVGLCALTVAARVRRAAIRDPQS